MIDEMVLKVLGDELAALKERLGVIETERDQARERVTALESEIAAMNARIVHVVAECDWCQQSLADLAGVVEELINGNSTEPPDTRTQRVDEIGNHPSKVETKVTDIGVRTPLDISRITDEERLLLAGENLRLYREQRGY